MQKSLGRVGQCRPENNPQGSDKSTRDWQPTSGEEQGLTPPQRHLVWCQVLNPGQDDSVAVEDEWDRPDMTFHTNREED